jgi:P-type E1-E2 ATPase
VVDADIPGFGRLSLEHLVLDVNGTIVVDGQPHPDLPNVLGRLSRELHVVAITADTRGTAVDLTESLGIDIHIIQPGNEAAQKAAFVEELGASQVVAIGNGANDVAMLEAAALGIAVIGREGAYAGLLGVADVVVSRISDALGLLAEPQRLRATLRR